MLRFLYRCVLRAHPEYFQRRFGQEMLGIFDQAASPMSAAVLLLDGVVSLIRQWMLRPEFWDAPMAQASSNGAPLFASVESPRPRTTALVYGALLSALVLNGICWTMAYSWNHPIFIDIRPGYGPAGRVPEKLLRSAPVYHPTSVNEPPLSTDQGPVLLVFKSPRRMSTPIPGSAASEVLPTEPTDGADAQMETLRSYVGIYRADADDFSTIIVTFEGEHLQVEVERKFKSLLLPVSPSEFVAASVPNCRIDFVKSSTGAVDVILIDKGGRRVRAFRQ
jgi:hypothetical protein